MQTLNYFCAVCNLGDQPSLQRPNSSTCRGTPIPSTSAFYPSALSVACLPQSNLAIRLTALNTGSEWARNTIPRCISPGEHQQSNDPCLYKHLRYQCHWDTRRRKAMLSVQVTGAVLQTFANRHLSWITLYTTQPTVRFRSLFIIGKDHRAQLMSSACGPASSKLHTVQWPFRWQLISLSSEVQYIAIEHGNDPLIKSFQDKGQYILVWLSDQFLVLMTYMDIKQFNGRFDDLCRTNINPAWLTRLSGILLSYEAFKVRFQPIDFCEK